MQLSGNRTSLALALATNDSLAKYLASCELWTGTCTGTGTGTGTGLRVDPQPMF